MKRNVAIVIPFHNQVAILERCLRSVASTQSPRFHARLILFDNASQERLDARLLDSLGFDWTLIPNTSNECVSRPWNTGMRIAFEAGAEAVCLMNSDVMVGDGWMDQCVRALDRGALCAAPFNYTDHGEPPGDFHLRASLAAAGDLQQAYQGLYVRRQHVRGEDYYQRSRFDVPVAPVEMHETEGFCGYCFWLSRECVETIGWIDEEMTLVCSDTDYRNRLIRAGRPPVCVHTCLMHHFGSVTVRPLMETEFQQSTIARDKEYFERKWPQEYDQSWRGHCIGKSMSERRLVGSK